MPVLNQIDAAYVGEDTVDALYLGTDLIWSGSESGAGWGVPAGSLDRWRAALADHVTQRVEVLILGDSTTFGTGGYPWPQRLRELVIAADLTEGGLGIVNGDGTVYSGPDNLDTITAESVTSPGLFSFGILHTSTSKSNAVDEYTTFQGKGTKARVWLVNYSTINATVAVSVDGGAETTITPTGTVNHEVEIIDLGAEGTHTVTVRNASGGGAMYAVEFLRDTGIVWHNHGIPSLTASSALTGPAYPGALDTNTNMRVRPTYGLTRAATPNPPYPGPIDTDPDARDIKLAIIHMGINDQQTSVSASDYEGAIRAHIALARAVDADPLIIIPHFEAASNSGAEATYQGVLESVIADERVAWCDFGSGGALGPFANWGALGYGGGGSNPHLTELAYRTQAEFLFTNVLARTVDPVLPANTVAPAVTGTEIVGATVSCSQGTWEAVWPTPVYTYQWKRNGTAISGATASTYQLQALDADQSIKCTVTATNTAGVVSVDSNTITPTAPFAPTSIANLAAWWDAGQISGVTADGTAIASWTDMSGNGRHAIQATGANQPILKTGPNGINNQPVVRFDGSNDWLKTASFTQAQPLTVFIVYKPIAHPTGGSRALFAEGAGFDWIAHTTSGVLHVGFGANLFSHASQFLTLAKKRIIRVIVNGASSSIVYDNAVDTTSTSGNAGTNSIGGGMHVGGVNGGDRAPNSDFAEVIVYSRVLNSTEIGQVESYLSVKYDIAIA